MHPVKVDISDGRELTKILAPSADFDAAYTFYYDETNNIRKFHVKESGFNSAFTNNFVLGGLVHDVHDGSAPDVKSFIDSLNLQKNVNEVKFKQIASGDFLACLKSKKLHAFFQFLIESKLYIHYSSVNILYWSIVDIVDSAIAHCDASQQLCPQFASLMKNNLYKLSKIEIDSLVHLFREFEYPNIKKDKVILFIEALSDLFADYLDTMEFHFGLESLRQILKEAKGNESLPFVMDGEDFLLIVNFSDFYMRPIYLFKNSKHIFDNEDSISDLLSNYSIVDGEEEIRNYSFVDSKTNQLIQLSDVLVGIIGKMHNYLNINNRKKIYSDFQQLNVTQNLNVCLLLKLIDKSLHKNIGFFHAIDCEEEISKVKVIRERMEIIN